MGTQIGVSAQQALDHVLRHGATHQHVFDIYRGRAVIERMHDHMHRDHVAAYYRHRADTVRVMALLHGVQIKE